MTPETAKVLLEEQWTDERPEYWPLEGWNLHTIAVRTPMSRFVSPVILELGVYCGKFSEYLMRWFPQAKLIAVDTWRWIHPHHAEKFLNDPRNVRGAFMHHLWPYRDRVRVYQMDTIEAMHALADEHVDWVYVDSDHRYASVMREIDTVLRLFPDALITGDDYEAGNDVGRAVRDMANHYALVAKRDGRFWWYE